MRFRLPLIALTAIAAVAGCDGSDPVAAGTNNTAALPEPSREAVPSPTGAPPTNDSQTRSGEVSPPAAATIPAALQGRWGMVPEDCISTRGDAKGLLTISANDLRFYESRAVPSAGIETDSDSISGDFTFTGEGQTWSKYVSLRLQKEGLVRTETNPTASYSYAKCT